VLNEQVGEEIKAAGLEIGSGVDSRGRGHKKSDGIGCTTEREAGKGCSKQ
jgi:hypothetical protein